MWIWLLAVLLIVGVWVGGYFLAWTLTLKVLLSVVVIVLVIAWIVGRRIRAMLKARALERELLRQAQQQALDARPEKRPEVLEVQVQMQRALAALKTSRLGSSGESALYSLPWYMIIGPPGAGKTTALKHSGLVFPVLDPRSGGGIRGVGGTRNCDWWFTNEGILLDTAGRYATEADDHDEWISFVDLLRKYRSQKPINGVIIAISVTDLMEATDDQIDSYAKRLRERIDEVTTRLQMVVPVYVMFTKVDLVAGFVEFWGDLRKSERAQIWGVTVPLEGGTSDAGKMFESEFDLLVEGLHNRALRRVGSERQADQRQRIYQFPLEFAALKQNLRDFVGTLLQPNGSQEAPILRGIYFSSGTQEGRPIDRVIGGMMRAFNLPSPAAAEAQPATDGKSYFVTDMFRHVIFPDQHIAARTRGEVRRQLLNRVAFAVAALALAFVLVAPSIYTFSQNMELVGSVRDTADKASKVNWADGDLNILPKVHKLDDLGAQLDQLEKWRADGPPLRLRWGMYEGDALYEPLRTEYTTNLEKGFATPTRAELERELSSLSLSGASRLNLDQYNYYFGRLKAYLEMTEPARIDDREPDAMTEAWSRALGTTAATDKAALRYHVARYVQYVQRGEIPPWRANVDLVTRVRSVLKQTSEAERDYGALIREPNETLPIITRSSVFIGSSFATYVTSKSKPEVVVRGAFTKEGWEKFVRGALGSDAAARKAQDGWVLGETEQLNLQRMQDIINGLRDRYFAEYRNAWADFLKDLEVRKPESNSEALDELQSMTETQWPYFKLLNVLAENTRLEAAPEGPSAQGLIDKAAGSNATLGTLLGTDGGAAAGKRWISPVEEAFDPMVVFGVPPPPPKNDGPVATPPMPIPTNLGKYNTDVVGKIMSALSGMKDSKVPGDPKEIIKTFGDGYKATSELLSSTQSGFTRPLLSPLLMNPIRLSFAGVLSDVAGAAGGKWELDVWAKWHEKLEGKYPFTDSPTDATIADYTAFFKPDKGLLWAFYKKYLEGSLERDGDSFTPVSNFQHSINYTPDFLKCYTRGAVLTDDTFGEGSAPIGGGDSPAVAVPTLAAPGPVIEFDVNLHSVSESVSEVTFNIDGAERTYKNTPQEWLHAQWPAKESKTRGTSVVVRGYGGLDEEIARPGDFGLFRMLDGATSIESGTEGGKPGGTPTIVVTWNLKSQNAWVRMDVRLPQTDTAFSSYLTKHERPFRNYKCPRIVSSGVR